MDALGIFDAMNRASRRMQAEVRRRELQQDIAESKSKTCGNCDHWMKCTCKPEKDHGQFKSCGSCGCNDFSRTEWEESRIRELEAELDAAKETTDAT